MEIEGLADVAVPVEGFLRLLARSPVGGGGTLRVGVVNLAGDRSVQISWGYSPARRRRQARVYSFGVWTFAGYEGWPVMSGGRERIDFGSADPPKSDALLAIRALGADLAAALAVAAGVDGFTTKPGGYDKPVRVRVRSGPPQWEFEVESWFSPRCVRLGPADRADADLLALPWPPVVRCKESAYPDEPFRPQLVDRLPTRAWGDVIAEMAATLRPPER